MRNFFITTCCAIGISLFTLSVQADETSAEFTFRNIPWYSTMVDAEAILDDEGATARYDGWEHYARRLSGIEFTRTMSGSDYINDGGVARNYSGLTVAGYNPSEVGACYIYGINEDGSLNRNEDDAEFYFGWYTFESGDYVDGQAVYEDFLQKLSSLYGEGSSNDESKYFTTTDWFDSSNNQIRLLLGGKNNENYYVTIGYIANDADTRLDAVQEALDAEAIAAEAVEREMNKENVEGL